MGVIKLCDLECLPLVRVDSPLRDILKYTYIYNILIIFIYLFLNSTICKIIPAYFTISSDQHNNTVGKPSIFYINLAITLLFYY